VSSGLITSVGRRDVGEPRPLILVLQIRSRVPVMVMRRFISSSGAGAFFRAVEFQIGR